MATTVTLTAEECRALHGLIDQLSGGNAIDVFGDEAAGLDVTGEACAKVFGVAGMGMPEWVEARLEEMSWLELGRRSRARLWEEEEGEDDKSSRALDEFTRLFAVERPTVTVGVINGKLSLSHGDDERDFEVPLEEINV